MWARGYVEGIKAAIKANTEIPQIVYFASSPLIKRMGPFTSMLEASKAIIGKDGFPVEGCVIWCENGQN